MPIPYAFTVAVTKNGLVRECPACSALIPEDADDFGELTTNNYASHVEEEHMELEVAW